MNSMHKGSEKRKFKRVKVGFLVIYSVEKPIEVLVRIGNKEVTAIMHDLTEAGMCILSSNDIPSEAILLIKFTLINPYADKEQRVRAMDIVGEVRYSTLLQTKDYSLGIRFITISEEDRVSISDFAKMALST